MQEKMNKCCYNQNVKIKFLFLALLLAFISNSSLLAISESDGTLSQNRVLYDGPILHVFFHPLIAYPSRAFDKPKDKDFIQNWFITEDEFNNFLEALYKSNYIIVSIYDTIETVNVNGLEITRPKSVLVPPPKKPCVLSFDDVNYYPIHLRNGTVSKLIIDDKNELASLSTDLNGKEVISYDNEFPLILENFITKHPDFSMNNARGIIALTGFSGFLGYKTENPKNAEYASELLKAQKVATKLKNMGWLFACHSYLHWNQVKYKNDEEFFMYEKKWLEQASLIIGKTPLYIFPFGDSVIPYAKRFSFLEKLGYNVFMGVSGKILSNQVGNSLYIGRVPIDGKTLLAPLKIYKTFMNVKAVIDPLRNSKVM